MYVVLKLWKENWVSLNVCVLYWNKQIYSKKTSKLPSYLSHTWNVQRPPPSRASAGEDDRADELSAAQLHSVDRESVCGPSAAQQRHQQAECENCSFTHDHHTDESEWELEVLEMLLSAPGWSERWCNLSLPCCVFYRGSWSLCCCASVRWTVIAGQRPLGRQRPGPAPL